MIHQLFSLTRPLIVLDTETTGVDPKSDRIVEIAFQKWEPISEAAKAAGHDGMTKEWRSLVNPGVPIPAAATKVHGITNDDIKACRECKGAIPGMLIPITDDPPHHMTYCACAQPKPWPTFKQLAANLAKGFSDCDYAGKNVRFDLRIVAAEMARAGQPWTYAGARIVDAERLEQLAVPRSLSHLHEKYTGAKHDGAHGVLSDVRASTTVIAAQLTAHHTLSRDLDALHAAQWPGWLCDDGSFKVVDGVATCQFGKHRGRPMRSIPLSYYDWLLSAEFPADVKALAANAKIGKFPDGSS